MTGGILSNGDGTEAQRNGARDGTKERDTGSNDKLWTRKVTTTHGTMEVTEVRLYKKRFLILLLFCLYSMANAFQWIQYSILNKTVTYYYNTTELMVNLTSIIYMVVYIPGILPASWLLNKKGLRFSVLIGCFGTSLGAWVKCASVSPDRFWVTMTGQTIAAISQLFLLSLPPKIAAVWFGPNEVSRATAVGVFGNQLGIALGFVVPPLMVSSKEDKKLIGKELSALFYTVAFLTMILFVLLILWFEDKPPLPPSRAQAQAEIAQEEESYGKSIYALTSNLNYDMLLLSYGIMGGVFYAVSTVLSLMVFQQHQIIEKEKVAGVMGFIITVSGMFGSVFCGTILDTTHRYKETTLGIYIFSLLGMIVFSFAIELGGVLLLYLTSGLLGFFMTGYLPIGFEFASELSYPQPEGTSSGLLNASAQVFGIILTLMATELVETSGNLLTNIILCGILVAGVLTTAVIRADLRRRKLVASKVQDASVVMASIKQNHGTNTSSA